MPQASSPRSVRTPQRRSRRPRLCQSAAVLRRLPLLPLRNADAVQRGGAAGLFRLRPGIEAAAGGLSVRRIQRIHDRAPHRLVKLPPCLIRPRGALRLFRHLVRRLTDGRGHRRQLGRHQRHHRHARRRRDAARARHGRHPDPRPWPQSRGAGAAQGAGTGADRYAGAGRSADRRLAARAHRRPWRRCPARLFRTRRGGEHGADAIGGSSGAGSPSPSARCRSRCRSTPCES